MKTKQICIWSAKNYFFATGIFMQDILALTEPCFLDTISRLCQRENPAILFPAFAIYKIKTISTRFSRNLFSDVFWHIYEGTEIPQSLELHPT
jgi:hypothetical protein